MRTGDVALVRTLRHYPFGPAHGGTWSEYKPEKGKVFAVVMLGEVEDLLTFNPDEALRSLGWEKLPETVGSTSREPTR